MGNIRVLATGLEFPEGPVVMPDGSVVLVEIRGRRLTRVYPDGRKEVVAQIPGGPNGAALGPDGKMYICNNGGFSWIPTRNMIMPGPQPHDYLGGSIQRVDMQSGKVETVVDTCGEHPLRGPNDLVFDKHGGLWFSDLGKRRARDMDVGAFYYIKPGMKEIVESVHGILPANGIGLSPDENTVYIAETRGAAVGLRNLEPGTVKPRDPIYPGERQADRGPWRLPDVRFPCGRGKRKRLRCDPGLRLHLGDRARWHPRRAGADRRPCYHQYRLRRP
jgi:gluconolactonase